MRRDLAADKRDQEGDQRDQGRDLRDRAGTLRDDVADDRDRAGDQRELAANNVTPSQTSAIGLGCHVIKQPINETMRLRPGETGLVELERDMARDRETRTALTLAVVHVDQMKTLSARHGDEFGNRVLRDVADTLLSALSHYDLIVRISADEFICAVIGPTRRDADHLFASVSTTLSRRAS